MALDIKVKIDLSKPIGKLGYSYPLILVVKDTIEGESVKGYTEFKNLDEVIAAGYTNTGDNDIAISVYNTARTIFLQDNAPDKIAIVECAKSNETTTISDCLKYGWRQLITVAENALEATTKKGIANYIETTSKMYFCSVNDLKDIETIGTKLERTVVIYHNKTTPEAAVVGASAGLAAGSFSYKNLTLKNTIPLELTDTEIDEVHEAGAITIVEKAGDIVTTEGKVLSGEYIDIIDSKDFVIQNIEYKTQKVLNQAKKVPYDNNGIAMLESATIEVMREAYNNGIIATNDDGTPAYTVSFALRSATSEADRVARKYPYGSFSFVLAGAIHEVEVTGEISI